MDISKESKAKYFPDKSIAHITKKLPSDTELSS